MVMTVTDVLNTWNQLGVFSYVIPFLLIFAVVFALLEKSRILGDNRSIFAIVSASIGLLSLQFDFVASFFAIIFPKFGVGLSIFLVLLILIGFFFKFDPEKEGSLSKLGIIGIIVAIGVVLWSLSSWSYWTIGGGFGNWFTQYFWAIVILLVVIGAVIAVKNTGTTTPPPPPTPVRPR